jgi:hypothetical protein
MIWTLNQGVTEGGSSGSALFTSSGRQLIGQLYGGYSSCANPTGADIYGRFDLVSNCISSRTYKIDAFAFTARRKPQP